MIKKILRMPEIPKGFRGYKPEKVQTTRKIDIKTDVHLEHLKDAFRKHHGHDTEGYYNNATSLLTMNYSAADVEKFCLSLADLNRNFYKGFALGPFLSALVNNGRDNDYRLCISHIDLWIDYLGFRNRKKVTIEGNVGHALGELMERGIIIVNGNAGDGVGYMMSDGVIIVNGNAGTNVGSNISGGKIHINGNHK